jgi:hypothetical protein
MDNTKAFSKMKLLRKSIPASLQNFKVAGTKVLKYKKALSKIAESIRRTRIYRCIAARQIYGKRSVCARRCGVKCGAFRRSKCKEKKAQKGMCFMYVEKNKGQIIATTPHDDDCVMEDLIYQNPVPYFFGTERDGLSEEILQRADGFLKIDGGFTESLNISVSAAIIIQNLTNRLRHSKIDWHLSEEEMLEKRLAWAKNSY